MATTRTFVPFEGLWKMKVPVPVSFLVRDGDHAWTCGQLALDEDSNVLEPNDLEAQSRIVARYIEDILGRGDVTTDAIKRLVLYHCSDQPDAVAAMHMVFEKALGPAVILDAVRVPYFYYDGVMLEVDSFSGRVPDQAKLTDRLSLIADDHLVWASIQTSASELASQLTSLAREAKTLGLSSDDLVSAHWYVPEHDLIRVAGDLAGNWCLDPGAITNVGGADGVVGSLVFSRVGSLSATCAHDPARKVVVTARSALGLGWVRARSTDDTLDLIGQTTACMDAIAAELAARDLGFGDVVKSTAYYVAGSSPEELHGNMSVRHSYYDLPGPASTGLPVYGFGDERSAIIIDVVTKSG